MELEEIIEEYGRAFRPREGYWLTRGLLDEVSSARGCIEASLDLGITWRKICYDNGFLITDNVRIPAIPPKEHDRVVYVSRDLENAYEVIARKGSGFYKLKIARKYGAPTLEINGIHMHRIVGIDPWTDSKIKTLAARVKKKAKVLDTCMGLGYTAIHSLLRGADLVVTIEKDENVYWIAEHNPWSHGLRDERVITLHGDSSEIIGSLPDAFFDRIIHDPPRFTRKTGDLYSLEFYREAYRVLRIGGIMFHYTGEPHRHGGPSVLKGISERLRKAGFYPVFYDRRAQGFVCYKRI